MIRVQEIVGDAPRNKVRNLSCNNAMENVKNSRDVCSKWDVGLMSLAGFRPPPQQKQTLDNNYLQQSPTLAVGSPALHS